MLGGDVKTAKREILKMFMANRMSKKTQACAKLEFYSLLL
jgi:hypothetical protein